MPWSRVLTFDDPLHYQAAIRAGVVLDCRTARNGALAVTKVLFGDTIMVDSTPSAVVSIQVFSDLLKRCIKALAKYNAIAIVLDERVSAKIVLVDRT